VKERQLLIADGGFGHDRALRDYRCRHGTP
jgi:hypothetical protein